MKITKNRNRHTYQTVNLKQYENSIKLTTFGGSYFCLSFVSLVIYLIFRNFKFHFSSLILCVFELYFFSRIGQSYLFFRKIFHFFIILLFHSNFQICLFFKLKTKINEHIESTIGSTWRYPIACDVALVSHVSIFHPKVNRSTTEGLIDSYPNGSYRKNFFTLKTDQTQSVHLQRYV